MNTSKLLTGILAAVFAVTIGAFTACDDGATGNNNSNSATHEHQWGAWAVTTPATCTSAGVQTRVCALDKTHTDTAAVPVNPDAHNWGEWAQTKAPTETADGEETRTCALNAAHKGTRPVAALNHTHQWGEWALTKAPTATEAGEETRTCALNPAHTETRAVPATGVKQTAAAPVANPPAGTYAAAQSVTLTSATEGAAIHYTADGSAPTTASALYANPISVSATATIQAIAVKSGMNDSPVMSALYTINIAPQYPTKTFTVPSYNGRLNTDKPVTVEFRAGTQAEQDAMFAKLVQAWNEPPLSYVETADSMRRDANAVLARNLKIIIEGPNVPYYVGRKVVDFRTISFHADYM